MLGAGRTLSPRCVHRRSFFRLIDQIVPASEFFRGEKYHQLYLDNVRRLAAVFQQETYAFRIQTAIATTSHAGEPPATSHKLLFVWGTPKRYTSSTHTACIQQTIRRRTWRQYQSPCGCTRAEASAQWTFAWQGWFSVDTAWLRRRSANIHRSMLASKSNVVPFQVISRLLCWMALTRAKVRAPQGLPFMTVSEE